MFDISFLELLVVAVVALLVLGPERLPGAVRTAPGRRSGPSTSRATTATTSNSRKLISNMDDQSLCCDSWRFSAWTSSVSLVRDSTDGFLSSS